MTFESYQGNTPDRKTPHGSIERIQRLFSQKSGIFVSDMVAAHIWICVPAYLIERIAEIDVKRLQERNSPDRQLPAITGERVFSSFGNIVLSGHAVKGNTKHRWFTATELTEWHSSPVEAPGIGKEAFTSEKTVQSV